MGRHARLPEFPDEESRCGEGPGLHPHLHAEGCTFTEEPEEGPNAPVGAGPHGRAEAPGDVVLDDAPRGEEQGDEHERLAQGGGDGASQGAPAEHIDEGAREGEVEEVGAEEDPGGLAHLPDAL